MKVCSVKKASYALLAGAVFFILSGSLFGQNMFRKINDFDGDGKADFAVTRNIGGNKYWYIWQSANGLRVDQWGFSTDDNATGDYDGDGKIDLGIYRREPVDAIRMNYWFWVKASQVGYLTFGRTTNIYQQSIAVQQDYNGDGKTDFAFTHINGTIQTSCPSGIGCVYSYAGTPIRIGDVVGDGKAEVSEYSSSGNDNIIKIVNPLNYAVQTVQLGLVGDQYVPADFDGDGKGDLAVFRESTGTWWWRRSSDNALHAAQFGQAGDKPVSADYDGDGKTDLAIWRPGAGETQSYFWVYGSLGNVFVMPFGIGTDKVVTY